MNISPRQALAAAIVLATTSLSAFAAPGWNEQGHGRSSRHDDRGHDSRHHDDRGRNNGRDRHNDDHHARNERYDYYGRDQHHRHDRHDHRHHEHDRDRHGDPYRYSSRPPVIVYPRVAHPAPRYRYVYYPSHQTYYSPDRRLWYWRDGRRWHSGSQLPSSLSALVTIAGIAIALDTFLPYERHDVVVREYAYRY